MKCSFFFSAACLISLSSCAFDPHSGPAARYGSQTGAAIGAIAGGVIGHQSDNGFEGAALGGLLGGVLGYAKGTAEDSQRYESSLGSTRYQDEDGYYQDSGEGHPSSRRRSSYSTSIGFGNYGPSYGIGYSNYSRGYGGGYSNFYRPRYRRSCY